MIIIKLRGGLANQMFQYALGKKLSIKHNVPFMLDLVHYEKEQTEEKTIRNFGLELFNIDAQIATQQEINEAKGWFKNPLKRKANTLFNKLKPYYKQNRIKEIGPGFDSNILNAPSNCYLEGFWQSEHYFSDEKDCIVDNFKCIKEPSEQNKQALLTISNCNAVSIHIRRGDYVHSKHYQNVHQVLTETYYEEAIKTLQTKVEDPVFFVFSDDINWAKEHIKPKNKTYYIDFNDGDTAYEDLRLMQHCKHNIIANSTFSWWGAWLNTNPDKIVIAPEKWYKKADMENPDITPKSWLKVKAN